MSRGFITLGIDTEQDRVQYSYAMASSIKQCDSSAETCLVVDKDKMDNIPSKYYDAFDYIVELPFGNSAHKDGFHGMNIWQLYHCTPFEETIYLDSDTLVKNINLGLLWDELDSYDIAMSNISRTYRNDLTNKSKKFEFEYQYNLPKLYSNLIYFKSSSDLAQEWFKMADPVFQNWRDVYQHLFKEKKPATFSKSILANCVTHFLDCEQNISCNLNNLYDLDNHSQNFWNVDIPENWTDMLNYWFTDTQKIIIENSVISSGIIHYSDENFMNEEMISAIRSSIKISNRRKATA